MNRHERRKLKAQGTKMPDQSVLQPAQAAQEMRAEVASVSRMNMWDIANMALVIQKLVVAQQQAEAEKAELQARLNALQPAAAPAPQPETPAS